MAKTIDLLPCPFCGQWAGIEYDGIPADSNYSNDWWLCGHDDPKVDCRADELMPERGMTRDEAEAFASWWNRRAAALEKDGTGVPK